MLWFCFSTVKFEGKKMPDAKAPAEEPVIRLAIEVDRFEFEFTEAQAEDTIARLSAGLKALKAKGAVGA